jgi:hypothetical protein
MAAAALLLLLAIDLEPYRWQKRILLQLGGEPRRGTVPAGYDDRDLIWIHSNDDSLARRLGVLKRPGWLLIGKDGGVKARWSQAPGEAEIYGLIDAMPMRQAERRRRP